jgi:3-oxoacyl-[acyl-carrier-protein] synthase II
MTEACRVAGIAPEQVGYLNAHGTGTPLNDGAEAMAINRWAGASAPMIRVSSTKASVGHLLGAAGSVEAVICLMALRGQWLPPTATTREIDPVCRFDFVTAPREARLDYALTNSFGFGGANATLIFRRWS